ncbi:SRPBCC family protein [Nocardioides sp. LHG3406-4]|uniref:SRPBCC family protein n=1 Tax=Nocardioides sp. LHG3406-4 TaxID=2804575 RepID=UPI003CEFCAAE
MKVRWHTLAETHDDFFEVAPFRYVNSVDVPAPAEQTWAALTSDDALVSWSPMVTRMRWTSPRPFGVGTTCELTLLGFLTARERYYRWEEGRRKTFAAVEASTPGLRRLAEDFFVEGTPNGSRLVWTIVLEPHPALAPVLRLADPITAWSLRSVARGLRSRVA